MGYARVVSRAAHKIIKTPGKRSLLPRVKHKEGCVDPPPGKAVNLRPEARGHGTVFFRGFFIPYPIVQVPGMEQRFPFRRNEERHAFVRGVKRFHGNFPQLRSFVWPEKNERVICLLRHAMTRKARRVPAAPDIPRKDVGHIRMRFPQPENIEVEMIPVRMAAKNIQRLFRREHGQRSFIIIKQQRAMRKLRCKAAVADVGDFHGLPQRFTVLYFFASTRPRKCAASASAVPCLKPALDTMYA